MGGAPEAVLRIIFQGKFKLTESPARIGSHDRPLEFDAFDGQFDCGRKYFQTAGGLARNLGGLESLSLRGGGPGDSGDCGVYCGSFSRYEETGGLYLYARDALGRFGGLLVAWMTLADADCGAGSGGNLVWEVQREVLYATGKRAGKFLTLFPAHRHLDCQHFGVKTGRI